MANSESNKFNLNQIQTMLMAGDKEGARHALLQVTSEFDEDIVRRKWSSLYLEVELYSHALDILDKIDSLNKDDLIEKGMCYFALSKQTDALDCLRTSLLLKETSRGYYLLSVVLANNKKSYQLSREIKSEIIAMLTKATKLADCGPGTFFELDKYLGGYTDEENQKRGDNLKLALVRHPDNRAIRIAYAEFLRYPAKNPKESLEVLSPLLKDDDASAFWLAYEALNDIGDFKQALLMVERLKPTSGDITTVNKVKGDLYIELKNFEAAIECFNQEIACKKDCQRKIIGLFSRAYANLLFGDVDQAAKDATNAARLCFDLDECSFEPCRISVSEHLVDYYAFDKCVFDVCKAFVERADITPIKKDSEAFGQLCYLFSKYRSTERENDEASEDAPNFWVKRASEIISHPIISGELSDEYSTKNNYLAAIDHHLIYYIWKYRRACEKGVSLGSSGGFYNITEYNLSKTKIQAIHKMIKRHMDTCAGETDLVPLFASIYASTWSALLHSAQMYKEMLKITEVLTSQTDKSQIWFDFAYSNSSNGFADRAETAYRHYLELKPNSASALHNLSLLVEKTNLREAISFSEKAFELASEDKVIKERFDRFKPIIQFQKVAEASLKNPVDFDDLSLKDCLYLGAVLFACLSEDESTIFSVSEANKRLAPGAEYETEMLHHLWSNDILVIDPYSNIKAISLSSDGHCKATLSQVRWVLNVKAKNKMSHAKMLNELIRTNLLNDGGIEEANSLWREIALEEALEYLQYKRNSVNLSAEVSEKTREYFKDLMKRYSTAQMYNIVWNSVKNAVMYQREKGLSNTHAANLVASGCKQYGDKAMAEAWNLKAYRRNFDLPQSIISELLFNRLLGIGEAGFNCPPGDYSQAKNSLKLDGEIESASTQL